MAQRTGEKAAGTASGIEQNFTGLWVDAVDHEGGDSSRRVIFACVAGGLKVGEDLLVNVPKMLTIGEVVKINPIDFVDHLPHQLAGFHIIVSVLEHVFDHAAALARLSCRRQVLQGWEKLAIHEGQQFIPGYAFGVSCPIPPLELGGNRRAIIVLHQVQLLILVVDDFQEEHPAQLADALRIAIDAGILAHDVLNGFNDGADGHI
jgi:hypothetical protein